jgi:hypothetical protein
MRVRLDQGRKTMAGRSRGAGRQWTGRGGGSWSRGPWVVPMSSDGGWWWLSTVVCFVAEKEEGGWRRGIFGATTCDK